MSRRSNKTQARARAGRRAKCNRKRPRQQRREAGRTGREGGTFNAVPSPWGMPAMIGTVNDANFADHQMYLGAHSLLPPTPPWASSPKPVHIARAFDLMASARTPSESRLWAIVVLGHTPQKSALEVLRQHGRSASRYAGVARIAADECAEWIRMAAEDEAETAPRHGSNDLCEVDRDKAERVTDQAELESEDFEEALGPDWSLRRTAPADLLN